jgi:ABC-type glycerol-3-phosphate transport system substrate-binding protein
MTQEGVMMKRVLFILSIFLALTTTVFSEGKQEKTGTTVMTAPTRLVYFVQPPANYKPTSKDVLDKIKAKILADTNVEVDIIIAPIDPVEYNNKLNLMLAGGEQIDIFLTNGWEELQRNGVLADLSAEVQKDKALLDVFGKAMEAMKTSDGKIWGIPRNGDAVHYPVWIRKDWLSKLNLPVPKTIEEYEKTLKAFKEADLAGNGKTIPMLTAFENMSHCLLGAFTEGGSGIYGSSNGKIYPFFMDPGYKDMLVALNGWYKNGYIDKESFIYKDSQRIDLIKQGRVGSTALWFSRVSLNEQELKKLDPNAEYVVASLTGPKGKAETVNAYARLPIGISTATGTTGYVVSKKCKDVAAAMRVLSWGFTNVGNYITSRYGLENEGWKWVDKEKGIFELVIPQTGDEYCMYKGLVTEMAVREKVSPNEKHVNYIFGKEIVNFNRAKYPKDGGIHFDMKPIYAAVPNVSDILRIHQEETIKFITGGRLFDEYDNFLEQLKKSGIETLSDEITKQYKAIKK